MAMPQMVVVLRVHGHVCRGQNGIPNVSLDNERCRPVGNGRFILLACSILPFQQNRPTVCGSLPRITVDA